MNTNFSKYKPQEQLGVYGATLEQAMAVALNFYATEFHKKESPYLSELMSIWYDDRKSDKLNPIRQRSLETLRFMSNKFKSDFADLKLSELNQEVVEKYLAEKSVSNIARKINKFWSILPPTK